MSSAPVSFSTYSAAAFLAPVSADDRTLCADDSETSDDLPSDGGGDLAIACGDDDDDIQLSTPEVPETEKNRLHIV